MKPKSQSIDMSHQNVEFKARCDAPDEIRTILEEQHAEFQGTDHQTDTYFRVDEGRLKLREGNIENNLIYYERPDREGPKEAEIHLFETEQNTGLKSLLTAALGIRVVVNKKREIYFIENVKFHIDRVETLGSFVEVEAIDQDGDLGREKLHQQCRTYLEMFGIEQDQLISRSYSDLILSRKNENE